MKEGRSSEGNTERKEEGGGGSCREKEEEEKETKRRKKRRRRGRKRRKEEEEKERRKRRRKRSLRTGVEWTTASSRAGLNASGRWWPRGRRRKTSQPRSGVISFRARSVLVAGELKGEVAQVDFFGGFGSGLLHSRHSDLTPIPTPQSSTFSWCSFPSGQASRFQEPDLRFCCASPPYRALARVVVVVAATWHKQKRTRTTTKKNKNNNTSSTTKTTIATIAPEGVLLLASCHASATLERLRASSDKRLPKQKLM